MQKHSGQNLLGGNRLPIFGVMKLMFELLEQ